MTPLTNILFLLLISLAESLDKDMEQINTVDVSQPYGPLGVVISGRAVVTVGIPYAFLCSADCSPTCTYTWTREGQVSQGPELSIFLKNRVSLLVLTCEARNPNTGVTATATRTLKVAVGPRDVQIKGPGMLSPGVTSMFVCSAECYPACTYSWTINSVSQSNMNSEIQVTPTYADSESLVCEARNPLSGLFAAAFVKVWVARGPVQTEITGPSTVTAGSQYTFLCIAYCTPSCSFTWFFNGKNYTGDQVSLPILSDGTQMQSRKLVITIEEYKTSEQLQCKIANTLSGNTDIITKTLTVLDPIAVKPATQASPIANQTFSLQCVGAKSLAHIEWTKNNQLIVPNGRVQLSDSNTTLTFDPLLQSDTGDYQCVVSEGGVVIPGISYQMNVEYGPLEVVITEQGQGAVKNKTLLQPDSQANFHCTANCYPPCSYTWTLNNQTKDLNANFSLSPVTVEDGGTLTCLAYNTVTKEKASAETMLEIIEGPSNVTISGPSALEVGVKASLLCSSSCSPSCNYTWNIGGQMMFGSRVEILVNRFVSLESIVCTASNTVTGRMVTVSETLIVLDPDWCAC